MNSVSFANLVCKFGEDLDLLDLAVEVVLPAFFDDTLIRTYGEKTEFFFLDQKLLDLGTQRDPNPVIVGRFVKNTLLTRDQFFDEDKGLVEDYDEMESSPSSFFVLMMRNHKLIFLAETPHAPSISAYASTLAFFIRKKLEDFIDQEQARLAQTGNRPTKAALKKKYPKPRITALPLSSKDSIDKFVKSFQLLKRVEFRLIRPNQEIDRKRVWRDIRNVSSELGSNTTTLIQENSDGLSKSEAVKQVHDAGATGNQIVKLIGKDENGNVIRGNNESFKLSVPLTEVPNEDVLLASKLFSTFSTLVNKGTIQLDTPGATVKSILKKLVDLIN